MIEKDEKMEILICKFDIELKMLLFLILIRII